MKEKLLVIVLVMLAPQAHAMDIPSIKQKQTTNEVTRALSRSFEREVFRPWDEIEENDNDETEEDLTLLTLPDITMKSIHAIVSYGALVGKKNTPSEIPAFLKSIKELIDFETKNRIIPDVTLFNANEIPTINQTPPRSKASAEKAKRACLTLFKVLDYLEETIKFYKNSCKQESLKEQTIFNQKIKSLQKNELFNLKKYFYRIT